MRRNNNDLSADNPNSNNPNSNNNNNNTPSSSDISSFSKDPNLNNAFYGIAYTPR